MMGAVASPHLPVMAHLAASTWAVLAYLALGCSVFAFLAQTAAVQRTSASRASLLLGTEPVWAVATGIVLGGEHLTVTASIVPRSSLRASSPGSGSKTPTAPHKPGWPAPDLLAFLPVTAAD
jgi:threonine/homoserine efflux transporter RhtA